MKNKNEIKLGSRLIGINHPPLVIPEIGINHEGNIVKAKQMILDAYKAGAECVKFQCHVIDDEMLENNVIPKNANESIWTIMKRCSFSEKEEIELKDFTEELGLIYLSTPFSRAAADRLKKIDIPVFKIGSGECNNYPLIKHIASFGKPVILSTGMNDIQSISKSIMILENANLEYAILHTTSMYPTPYSKVRLGALDDLKNSFPDVVIGLSDHSIGNYTCFAAIPSGASILEKHFTSDKTWPGPDISTSIDPTQLADLIIGSKAIHDSLGGTKTILKEEQSTIDFAYACVVSITDIHKGDFLSKENIWVKRPGNGEIKAENFESLLNKKINVDISKNTQITWNMISD
jgi:N-acetylneuraminate synthase